MKRLMSVILLLSLISGSLSGCTEPAPGKEKESEETNTNISVTPAETTEADFSGTAADMFTDRDRRTEYSEADAVRIELKGDTASASANSVRISGSVITITEEKTHIISGTLDDGMIIVDADDAAKVQLVFNGVHIHCSSFAPVYIREADKVFITLADGTENTLSGGDTFSQIDDNTVDGVLFSRQDLTLNGSGSLTVTSPSGHGIVCKDDFVVTGGEYSIVSASHGIDANDSVRITGASFTIDAGKDGIHGENNDDASLGFVYIADGVLNIEAEGDGISAGAYLQIDDGTIGILAGGGSVNGTKQSSDSFGGFMGGGRPGYSSSAETADESSTSMKGLKSGNSMQIAGGTITIDSADDAVHSDMSLTVSGGTFTLSSGDDALHAEENLTVTAGSIQISESYEGLEALHIKVEGGDIRLTASDDGLNAAGGTDASGTTGGRDGMFGGGPGGMGGDPGGRPGGGMGGGMSANSDGSVEISGGTLYINASGDGIDATGTLTISGGHTTVVGPTRGDTATLDYDISAVITGGTFIGTGASGMAQTFSDSEQGVISLSVGNQSAGTEITLTDAEGNIVVSYAPELSFAVVILSTPDMVKGETYTITVGEASGEFAAD